MQINLARTSTAVDSPDALPLPLVSIMAYMASPACRGVDEDQQKVWSGFMARSGVGVRPSLSPAKARQAQRRYRSLFHQAAKEYLAWREGEDDCQRALGSAFHLLDRLRLLEPDNRETDGSHSLGGLENLPGCRELLVRKHIEELERVMRLWRALAQQMRGQVSRVEEFLAEAWQLHRSDQARALLIPHQPPQQSPRPPRPPPPTPAGRRRPRESSSPLPAASQAYGREQNLDRAAPEDLGWASPLPSPSPSSRGGLEDIRLCAVGSTRGHGRYGGETSAAPEAFSTAAGVGGGGQAAAPAVGPAEYLQWLGDMSSMLVHEQWRKDVLLSRVAYGPEAEAARVRAHVQAHWSSRSVDSFLDRSVIDAAMTSAQAVPLSPRAR